MTPPPRAQPVFASASSLLVFAVAYWTLAWLGSLLSIPAINFVTFWLPSGLYVSGLLLAPPARRLALIATACGANLAFDLVHGQSLGIALIFTSVNTLEALVGSTLVRRWIHPHPTGDSVREVLGIIGLAGLGSTALSALLGALAATLNGGQTSWGLHWLLWWTACAAGVVIVAPLVLAWARGRCPLGDPPPNGQILEGVVLALIILVVSHVTIHLEWLGGHRLTYLVLPLVGWGAIRFGTRGAALATLIVALTFAAYTSSHPSGGPPSPLVDLILRQVAVVHTFIVVLGLAGLLLAAVIHERRRAEERVRQSEAKARALMETPNSYSILITRDAQILDASRTVVQALRLTPDEIFGQSLLSFLPPETGARLQHVVQDAFTHDRPARFEEQHVGGWYDCLISPVPDRHGHPTYVSIVAWDITTQKRREAEIQRLTLLHACLGLVNHAIVRVETPAELYRRVCEALVDHGPFPAAVIGFVDPVPNDLVAHAHRDRLRPSTTPPEGWGEVGEIALRDGRTAHGWLPDSATQRVAAAAVPVRIAGHVHGVLWVRSTDPTPLCEGETSLLEQAAMELSFGLEHLRQEIERSRAEKALRESETRFRQFFETLNDHAFMVSTEGIILDANRAALATLGASHDEVVGSLLPALYAPENREAIRDAWNRARQGDEVRGLELTLVGDGDSRHLVEANIIPVRDESGEVALGAVVQTDVTVHRQMGDELRQAQKMEAIGQLAGGLAHDFNNVLAAIMVHLGLMKNNPGLDPANREIVEELEVEARRAAGMTRQLLLFSRRSVMQLRILDVNEVIENLLKMLRRLLGEHVRLEWHATPALPRVEGDSGMLEQVVMNLAVNARDAMDGGGRLTISTQSIDVPTAHSISHPEARPGRYVRLSVEDTGAGIDDDTLKHLFEPFFTTKSAGHGTGLGLATVYGIVRQHRGWLEVHTQLGAGSVFHVYLPGTTKTAPPVAAPADSPEVRGGDEVILLVEDEPSVRRAAAQCLRLFGYRVFEAAHGNDATAIWQAQKHAIDLLAVDMVLPGDLSGTALARQFQSEKPDLVVVVSTGYSTERGGDAAASGPGVVYLAKPYEAKVLGATVRAALDRRGKA
ncbi:MAG: PAS domain S-box protein [Verrucomicrobiales bacterium]|nr:PAS domain S-box protein [Verrucomicrobiales bacterium]